MTNKDYEALAYELRAVPSLGEWNTWIGCVIAVARVLARDNPRFDRGKFLKACGVSDA